MNRIASFTQSLQWLMSMLLLSIAAGCGGGGGNTIMGTGGVTSAAVAVAAVVAPPTVIAVTPLANAGGVPINVKIITATFSKAMNPATLTSASFTLACPLAAPVIGTVSYVAASKTADLTIPLATPNLPTNTVCTATVTTTAQDSTGLPLATNFVWQFTTGLLADTTKPRVILTSPITTPGGLPTPGVPSNTAISATFSEDMNPASITASSFTLSGPGLTPVAGAAIPVTYTVGSRTATFTPAAALTVGTTYTATIKGIGITPATDLAGNALAGNPALPLVANDYVWAFIAAAPAPTGNITVLSNHSLCPNAVNVTFSVPSGLRMNLLTIIPGSTFTVTGPAPALTVVSGTIALDAATGHIATFTPTVALTPGSTYTVTILGGATGVKDVAIPVANSLAVTTSWTFIAGTATGACVAPPGLVAAATFANYGGSAGNTNQGLNTIMNGDIATIAASTLVTGFHDAGPGCTYTETPLNVGVVNGLIYTAAPPPTVGCPSEGTAATFAIAQAAALDAYNEFNALAGLPAGTVLAVAGAAGALELGTRTLAPGTYDSASTYGITLGDLTLDAGGNANAVWVFRLGTSLTMGIAGPAGARSIILSNGAQAKNVYWIVGTGTNGPGRVIGAGAGAATINGAGGGIMVGTIIATAGVSFSTAGVVTLTTLNGRALSVQGPLVGGIPAGGASVTMTNTIINVPAP